MKRVARYTRMLEYSLKMSASDVNTHLFCYNQFIFLRNFRLVSPHRNVSFKNVFMFIFGFLKHLCNFTTNKFEQLAISVDSRTGIRIHNPLIMSLLSSPRVWVFRCNLALGFIKGDLGSVWHGDGININPYFPALT